MTGAGRGSRRVRRAHRDGDGAQAGRAAAWPRRAVIASLLPDFPFSHSATGALVGSTLAAPAALLLLKDRAGRRPGAAVIGLAVLLHFLGDVVEHPLQLTVAGPGSARLGLGLWLCLCATQTLPRGRRAGAAVRFLAVAAVAVAGQAASQAPPDPRANAAFWIVGPVVLALAARRLDRSASATPPP